MQSITQRRVALVVGNATYRHAGELRNPSNDASRITETLQRLNFQVITCLDVARQDFERAIRLFVRDLEGADAAVFFYAGHGLQVGGVNYLLPTDAEIEREADVRFNAIKLGDLLEDMGRACKTNLIFLDACRNNPLARSLAASMGQRSAVVGQGLATVQSAPGAFIAYATQPDNVAADGKGDNSPFTAALVRNLEAPGLSVDDLMYKVRTEVFNATDKQQIPWHHSSLFDPFRFREGPPSEVLEKAKNPWNLIRDSRNPALIRSFINQFSDAPEAVAAQRALEELEHEEWQRCSAAATITELAEFSDRFPGGRFSKAAQQRIALMRRRVLAWFVAAGFGSALLSSIPGTGSSPEYLAEGVFPIASKMFDLNFVFGSLKLGSFQNIFYWYNLGTIVFAVLIPGLAIGVSVANIRRLMLAFVIIQAGWAFAHGAWQIGGRLTGSVELQKARASLEAEQGKLHSLNEDMANPATSSQRKSEIAGEVAAIERKMREFESEINRLKGRSEIVIPALTGLITVASGVIGASSILFALWSELPSLGTRRMASALLFLGGMATLQWWIVFGNSSGMPIKAVSEIGPLVLFVPWQVTMATVVGWACVGSKQMNALPRK